MEFGERLKVLREERGWTQRQLATRVGTAQTNVHQWETGVNATNLKTLHKLREVFGCSWNTLLGDL